MDLRYTRKLGFNNFLFWLSRKIDYPLRPPDMVQVNFTFKCNLACAMCSMNEQMKFLKSLGRRTEIDSDTFRKIIREAKEIGTDNILFIGGEPLTRSDLFGMVKYAKILSLNTVIVTNGILLNEENIRRSMDADADWFSISIDAATEPVFGRIRGRGALAKIIGNIELLNKLKKENRREFPKITIVCTIMNDNLEELPDVARLCRRLKAEKIIFQPLVVDNANQSCREPGRSILPPERFNVLDNAIDSLIGFKKASAENFSFIANSIQHLSLIKKYFKNALRAGKLPCYAGYNRLQIAQDYRAYFCIPPNKKLDASFGDVSKDNLKNLWYSKDARARRRLIRRCGVPCAQWCSYREDFMEFYEIFQKQFLFKKETGKK